MMEFLGMTENDIVRPTAEVWPEHVRIVDLLQTYPWRVAPMGGVIGLDNKEIRAMVDLMRIPEEEWPEILMDLRAIEQAALPLLNK